MRNIFVYSLLIIRIAYTIKMVYVDNFGFCDFSRHFPSLETHVNSMWLREQIVQEIKTKEKVYLGTCCHK